MTIDTLLKSKESLSSRRAWIEICCLYVCIRCFSSLSSRRAWIEMLTRLMMRLKLVVALLTESVD